MRLIGDEKGVSPLLGFILMLMILMISISALQTQFVPDVCKDIEADHMKQITSQLLELKSVSSTKNVKLDMGVDYPEYLFLITPRSTATTMNVKEFNVSVEYTEILANGSKIDREINLTSSRIEISPNYLFYPKDELILENTAVLKRAGGNYVSISDQRSFKNEVNFMLLNATFDSVSSTQSLSVFSVPQSSGGRVMAENLSISFESVYPQYWEGIEDYNVTVNGNNVTIREDERIAFGLDEVMLYTGNKRSTESNPSRMVKTNSLDNFSLKEGESVKMGVKVLDKHNNPIEGVNVNASASSSIGETSPSNLYTDSDGEVYTTFSAQNVGVGTVTFNCSELENNVSYNVSITTITGDSSLSISLSSDPDADVDGYSSKTVKAYVSSEGDPLPGFNVVFAANSTDANFNSTEVKTSHSGYASATVSQSELGANWHKVYGYAGSAIDSLDVLLNTSWVGEVKIISNVKDSWETVNLANSYGNPVVVCTYNLKKDNNNEALVRIDNVQSQSFDMKIQNPENDNVNPNNVYCVIIEEGDWTLSDGTRMEAYTVVSDGTNHDGDWSSNKMENAGYSQSYNNPVVVGQVMSYNDSRWSTFWSSNGNSANPYDSSNLYTGKHVGEDTETTRNNEILGYVVIEEGSGTLSGINYEAALGGDSIRGVDDSPPYSYGLGDTYSVGVASNTGMDGPNGGWAVLYGNNPLSSQIDLAIDEDTIEDWERSHTTEQVGYLVFDSEGSFR